MYYIMEYFFADRVAIFSIESDELKELHHYSDKQHKGNVGEGQFHLNPSTFKYHMDNYFKTWLTYEELLELISPEPYKYKVRGSA